MLKKIFFTIPVIILLLSVFCILVLIYFQPDKTGPHVSGAVKFINDNRIMHLLEKELVKSTHKNGLYDYDRLERQIRLKKDRTGHCDVSFPDLSGRSPGTLNPAGIYKKYMSNVVIIGCLVHYKKKSEDKITAASGFFINKSGVIATCCHVIFPVSGKKIKKIVILTSDGKAFPVSEIIAINEKYDVAIIKIKGENFTSACLKSDTQVGSPITIISHPGRKFYTLTTGVVARYYEEYAKGDMVPSMLVTADFAPGSSGAPIYNENGEVAGMARYYQKIRRGNDKEGVITIKSCVPSESILKMQK